MTDTSYLDTLTEEAAPKDALERISSLAADALHLESDIEQLEELVAQRKRELREVLEKQLPESMAAVNMSSFVLENGFKINVKPFYSGSINEDNQDKAFEWLIENGHKDMIKREFKVNFQASEVDQAEDFAQKLSELNTSYSDKMAVHPMTLRSFIKEMVEGGQNIPFDTFKVYIGQKAEIKAPKN